MAHIKKESGEYVKKDSSGKEYTTKVSEAHVYAPRGAKIQATRLSNSTGNKHVAV